MPFEILLGSNGSTDDSAAIAAELATEHPVVRGFALPRRGVGRTFRRFVEEARHEALVSLDMDLSIDLDFLPRALRLLQDHEIVVGSKQAGNQRRSWLRRAGSVAFLACERRLLGLGVDDYSMAAKAYRLEAIRPVAPRLVDGTAYVLYALAAVSARGGSICQIPVGCEDYRRSRFNLAHEAAHKFYHLARIAIVSRRRAL